jgi:AcrR family transcriptional regulator
MALPSQRQPDEIPDLSRRERRKREVRDRIVEAAVALFEKQGPQATKVDDICEVADVAQKTFFNHFATKQHLVSEIATTFLENLLATLDELRESNRSAADRIEAFFSNLAERSEAAGPMHRELVLEVIRVAHLQHHEPAQMRFVHDAFRSFLEDCRDELRSDQPIETLAEMVVGTFYVLMLNWVSIDDYPLHERSVAAGRLLAESLTTRN